MNNIVCKGQAFRAIDAISDFEVKYIVKYNVWTVIFETEEIKDMCETCLMKSCQIECN